MRNEALDMRNSLLKIEYQKRNRNSENNFMFINSVIKYWRGDNDKDTKLYIKNW